MSEHGDSYYPAEVSELQQSGGAIDFSRFLWVLRKRWPYPFIGCLFFFIVAATYLTLKPQLYNSTAQLLIDRSLSQYLTRNQIVGQPSFDIGSQVYILKSDSVLVPVVQSLNLSMDPEFVGGTEPQESKSVWSEFSLKKFLGQAVGSKVRAEARPDTPRERIAVETLLQRLSVFRADVPTVINITVGSMDPTKAALISNAIAETYLATIQKAKNRKARFAATFLKDRLEELKDQLLAAEKRLQAYKIQHNLTTTRDDRDSEQRLNRLRSDLVQARLSLSEAHQRIEGAKLAAKSGVVGILADERTGMMGVTADNRVITQLRVQRIGLRSQLRSIVTRVGPKHPTAMQLKIELRDLDSAIRAEGRRIVSIYENRYAAQEKRIADIEVEISELTKKLKEENKAKNRMRELEATTASLSTLYNNAIQQYNQLPQVGLNDDARIISKAVPSKDRPKKKALIILFGATVFGLVMGASIPIGRELFVAPFRTASQLRTELGLSGVVLPFIQRKRSLWKFVTNRRDDGPIEEWVLNFPLSYFADGIRNIEARVFSANDNGALKVVCVTSCVPGEGKTTVLANLAASIAAEPWGLRVLVIDCDLHKRNMTKTLAADAEQGLFEALAEPSKLGAYTVHRDTSHIDILPCVSNKLTADAAKILGSGAMRQVLDVAQETYDVVLIEVPPVMSVVDVKMIERFVDGFVLVMEWGVTRRRLVSEALAEMDFLQDRLICVALNKADLSALEVLESYKGRRWEEYYNT